MYFISTCCSYLDGHAFWAIFWSWCQCCGQRCTLFLSWHRLSLVVLHSANFPACLPVLYKLPYIVTSPVQLLLYWWQIHLNLTVRPVVMFLSLCPVRHVRKMTTIMWSAAYSMIINAPTVDTRLKYLLRVFSHDLLFPRLDLILFTL